MVELAFIIIMNYLYYYCRAVKKQGSLDIL